MPAAAIRRFGLLSPRTATALGVVVLVLTIATGTLKGFDHQLSGSGTWSGIAIVVITPAWAWWWRDASRATPSAGYCSSFAATASTIPYPIMPGTTAKMRKTARTIKTP